MTIYKALLPITALFISLTLVTLTVGYKVVTLCGFTFSAVALVIPFRYILSDIVSEVYGYYLAKKLVWMLLGCCFIFASIVSSIILLPSPSYWSHHDAYEFVLGGTFRITVYAGLGVLVGSFVNIYLLSKWKRLVQGRYFILRSLGSSIFGELTQYVIGLTLMFHSYFDMEEILGLVFTDYALQVVILVVLSPFTNIGMYMLKKYENIDLNEQVIRMNPFALNEDEGS